MWEWDPKPGRTPSPGPDLILRGPSPIPGTTNGRVAASLGQADREQWEQTGAQLPEERRDGRMTGKVTLPRAGVDPFRGHKGGSHQLSMAVRFGAEAQW